MIVKLEKEITVHVAMTEEQARNLVGLCHKIERTENPLLLNADQLETARDLRCDLINQGIVLCSE